jgi:hypothetical protein
MSAITKWTCYKVVVNAKNIKFIYDYAFKNACVASWWENMESTKSQYHF